VQVAIRRFKKIQYPDKENSKIKCESTEQDIGRKIADKVAATEQIDKKKGDVPSE
jgi:hypothetical protein